LGEFSESYRPVEGGLFTSAKGTTLILQNASAGQLSYDPSTLGPAAHPTSVDLLVADDFISSVDTPAQVQSLDPTSPILIPPYSLVRLVWGTP
jgi:hypothetical protein